MQSFESALRCPHGHHIVPSGEYILGHQHLLGDMRIGVGLTVEVVCERAELEPWTYERSGTRSFIGLDVGSGRSPVLARGAFKVDMEYEQHRHSCKYGPPQPLPFQCIDAHSH